MVFDAGKGRVESGGEVFNEKKFCRIGLGGGCVLGGKLAVSSVQSQKPRRATSKLTLQARSYLGWFKLPSQTKESIRA